MNSLSRNLVHFYLLVTSREQRSLGRGLDSEVVSASNPTLQIWKTLFLKI